MKAARACIAQINTAVGDLRLNRDKVLDATRRAKKNGASLILFPELTLTGYPPEDLLFYPNFIRDNKRMLSSLAPASRGILMAVGFVDQDEKGKLYNAAAVLYGGKIAGIYRKVELPNYGVFDEKRYFEPGRGGLILNIAGLTVGLSICEDIWQPESFVYQEPYIGKLSLLLNLSASPYHRSKQRQRVELIRRLARSVKATVLYNNLVGGQDELVFDGGSMAVSAEGDVLATAKSFKEDLLMVDLPVKPSHQKISQKKKAPTPKLEAEVYQALVLGTRDYIRKNNFQNVLIGLSGGIDSALVARIAVDALGAQHVTGVTMPSRYTSRETLKDALELSRRLGIRCHEISIEKLFSAYLDILKPLFKGRPEDQAEENLQARIRGTLLMALSNKFGHMVLTTGNKSETATGYCTLYGDMAGGFAVLKDVPKTLVFRLARYRNGIDPKNSIPPATLKRAPTAELRHGQKDQDTLPPYPVLDSILEKYVESSGSLEEMLKTGHSGELVKRVVRMVDANEYKRRQAPPGIKITPKAFGRDRRMPITNRYRL